MRAFTASSSYSYCRRNTSQEAGMLPEPGLLTHKMMPFYPTTGNTAGDGEKQNVILLFPRGGFYVMLWHATRFLRG